MGFSRTCIAYMENSWVAIYIPVFALFVPFLGIFANCSGMVLPIEGHMASVDAPTAILLPQIFSGLSPIFLPFYKYFSGISLI